MTIRRMLDQGFPWSKPQGWQKKDEINFTPISKEFAGGESQGENLTLEALRGSREIFLRVRLMDASGGEKSLFS